MEGRFFVNIHQSAEDYLETILRFREDHGVARSIDIVHEQDGIFLLTTPSGRFGDFS